MGRPRGGMKVAARIGERGTAKRDRKRQTPKGGRRLATHLPSREIPVWWRRAVLPSLLWVVCFLSFFLWALTQEITTLEKKHRYTRGNKLQGTGRDRPQRGSGGPASSREAWVSLKPSTTTRERSRQTAKLQGFLCPRTSRMAAELVMGYRGVPYHAESTLSSAQVLK